MEKIAIVGAGLIGRAWAIVFARAGHEVALYDVDTNALSNCLELIAGNLADLQSFDLITESSSTVMQRIKPVASLEDAVHGASLVQENVRETLEAKREIFSTLDRIADRATLLASSTSWIPASAFSETLPGRARCLVAHPVNPPYLVPLVELSPAPWTAPEALTRAHAIYSTAGQVPVVIKKEIQGFILNRLQGAVLNEALNLYAEGYASAEDIDKTIRDGLGLRWSFMGPFETIDLNAPKGVVDYAQRYGPTYKEIAGEHRPFDWSPEVLRRIESERRQQLPEAELARRAQWRDRRLMALVAQKRVAPKN